MPISTIQVTLTGAVQPIIPNGLIAAKTLIIQNNSAAAVRVGDSSITATRGYNLPTGTSVQFANPFSGVQLSGVYVVGTATQLVDVTYDTGL